MTCMSNSPFTDIYIYIFKYSFPCSTSKPNLTELPWAFGCRRLLSKVYTTHQELATGYHRTCGNTHGGHVSPVVAPFEVGDATYAAEGHAAEVSSWCPRLFLHCFLVGRSQKVRSLLSFCGVFFRDEFGEYILGIRA